MPADSTRLQNTLVVAVVGGGEALRTAERETVGHADLVIAADSGVDRALEAGLSIDIAVGDFDSVTSAGLSAVESTGARIDRFDAAKDETDLELALLEALRAEPTRIVVVGLAGGRPDHALTSLLLLSDLRLADVEVGGFIGDTTISVIRGGQPGRSFVGVAGDLLSLVPLNGPAIGVETNGLAFGLRGETLMPASPRGMSNVFTAVEATVRLDEGTLLAMQPPRGTA